MKIDKSELFKKAWRMVKALKCTLSVALKFNWAQLKKIASKVIEVTIFSSEKLSYKQSVSILMKEIREMNYGYR